MYILSYEIGAFATIFEPSWRGTNVADEDISYGFADVAANYASSLTYVIDSHSTHPLKPLCKWI